MNYHADDFSGFGSLVDGGSAAQAIETTATVLRTTLGFMDAEKRRPTNRESLDVLSAIASISSGDTLAARMFARRALSFFERRVVPRAEEQLLYTTDQLRTRLEAALLVSAAAADPGASTG